MSMRTGCCERPPSLLGGATRREAELIFREFNSYVSWGSSAIGHTRQPVRCLAYLRKVCSRSPARRMIIVGTDRTLYAMWIFVILCLYRSNPQSYQVNGEIAERLTIPVGSHSFAISSHSCPQVRGNSPQNTTARVACNNACTFKFQCLKLMPYY